MKQLKALLVAFCILTAVLFLILSVGLVCWKIPVLGTISTFLFQSRIQYIIPICFGSTVFWIVWMLFKKKKLYLFLSVISIVTLVIHLFVLGSTLHHLQKENITIDFFSTNKPLPTHEVVVDTQIYADGQSIDVYYVPAGSKEKPIIVYMHGGGWVSGSRTNREYDARVFAKNGYVVFCMDYELSGKEQHLWKQTQSQMDMAMDWIQAHAKDYRASIKRLYLTGDSAGGNLALITAYRMNADTRRPDVRAVCVDYPIVDPVSFYNNEAFYMSDLAKGSIIAYTGGTPEQKKDAYEALTVYRYVNESCPPTAIFLGQADTLVPPEPSYILCQQLQDHNIDNQILAVPFANHILDYQPASVGNQAWLSYALQWFSSHS